MVLRCIRTGEGVTFVVSADDDITLRAATGVIDGRALTLLLDLERDGATALRPYAPWCFREGRATFALGITGRGDTTAVPSFVRAVTASGKWPAGATLHVVTGLRDAALNT
jgi:hypothetical protein